MSESELFTLVFWKTVFARVIGFMAVTASSVLVNAQLDSIKDVPWYGVASTTAMSGLLVLLASVGAAKIRDAAPDDVATTMEAVKSIRGRHAKLDGTDDANGR